MGIPPNLVDDGSDPGSWAEAFRFPNSITFIDDNRVASVVDSRSGSPRSCPTGTQSRAVASELPARNSGEAVLPGSCLAGFSDHSSSHAAEIAHD